MTRFVAFLRGINVGGHGIVKMEDLRRRFEELGLDNVRTYRASGNVVFETERRDGPALRRQVQKDLGALLGFEVSVFLRSAADLEALVRLDPFGGAKPSPGTPFVTFLHDTPGSIPPLPTRSPKSEVEVFVVRGRDVFSWGLPGR